MAIDFPNSPTLNQIYTVGSRSWIWDGSTWNIYANVPNRYIQDAAPSSPQSGDQWFESDTGRLFVYYDSAWVEIGNATDIAGALQPGQVTALSAVTSLTTDDVFVVVDNPSSATAANKITYGSLSGQNFRTHGCEIYHNANQTIANITATTLSFNSENADTDGYHSTSTNTSRITVPSGLGGFYAIEVYMRYDSNSTTTPIVMLRRNGNANLTRSMNPTSAFAVAQLAWVGKLAANDYVEVVVYHSSGANRNVDYVTDNGSSGIDPLSPRISCWRLSGDQA